MDVKNVTKMTTVFANGMITPLVIFNFVFISQSIISAFFFSEDLISPILSNSPEAAVWEQTWDKTEGEPCAHGHFCVGNRTTGAKRHFKLATKGLGTDLAYKSLGTLTKTYHDPQNNCYAFFLS